MTSQYENTIAQLSAYNAELQHENTKFLSKIIHLERTLQRFSSSNYKHLLSLTDTTNNFPLPSQILDKWNTFANNDINCCFIEFCVYPEVMFHIVQELFFIMQRMMKESVNTLLRKVLTVFGIKCSDEECEVKCKCLFNVIKPFLQEHYYDIFINEHSAYASAFDKTFMSNFALFYNREILPVVQSSLSVSDEMEMFVDVNNIMQSQSFKIMMLHVKEILIYFELSHQQLTLHVDDFTTRELMYVNDTDKEVIDVNGKTMPNYKKLILLNPPVYVDTNKPHPKYKAIILSYDANDSNVHSCNNNNNEHTRVNSNNQLYTVFMNSNSMKNLVTSPALSLRSSSYRNLYNFTTEHEHERGCGCDNNEDEDMQFKTTCLCNNNNNYNGHHHHHNKANTNVFFDNSMSPLSTDANNNNNNIDQVRTERISKAHMHNDDNSASHMRSLSKKSTITSDYGINIKNYNTTIHTNNNSNSNSKYTPSLLSSKNKTSNNSNNNNYHKYTNQKAKMFHLKRKGKEFHIEELSTNYNAPFLHSNMIYQNYNSKSNSTKNQSNNSKHITYLKSHSKHTHNHKHPFHRGITYNNIIGITSPIAFIKTANVHSTKTKLRQSAKTLNCNRSSTITNENTKNTKHKGSNSNSNSNTHNKKNSSLDKNVIEYKTNAITKVNISNLLSMQNKKQFIEFRKAFKSIHNTTNTNEQ